MFINQTKIIHGRGTSCSRRFLEPLLGKSLVPPYMVAFVVNQTQAVHGGSITGRSGLIQLFDFVCGRFRATRLFIEISSQRRRNCYQRNGRNEGKFHPPWRLWSSTHTLLITNLKYNN